MTYDEYTEFSSYDITDVSFNVCIDIMSMKRTNGIIMVASPMRRESSLVLTDKLIVFFVL